MLILLPKRFKLLAIGGVVIAGVMFFYHSFLITSIQERLDLWEDTIRGFKIFGNGVGSFEILYPLNAIHIDTALARPRFAHNDLLQLVFEYGLGVILLAPLAIRLIKANSEYKIILYGVGIISLFTFPFHVPMLAFIGCLVTGYVDSDNGAIWDIGNIRRPVLFKRA